MQDFREVASFVIDQYLNEEGKAPRIDIDAIRKELGFDTSIPKNIKFGTPSNKKVDLNALRDKVKKEKA